MVDEAEKVSGYKAVRVRWLSIGVVDDGIEDEYPRTPKAAWIPSLSCPKYTR